MAIRFGLLETRNGQQLWRQTMKQLLIAVTLVVAFAAPAMAENFSNPYAATMER
jgi:hypothetical protein